MSEILYNAYIHEVTIAVFLAVSNILKLKFGYVECQHVVYIMIKGVRTNVAMYVLYSFKQFIDICIMKYRKVFCSVIDNYIIVRNTKNLKDN